MNPILRIRRLLREKEGTLRILEHKHHWVTGRGTGYLPQHYGIDPAVWQAVWDEAIALRRDIIDLRKQEAALVARPRPHGRMSILAHGG